ncbi:hypothetical protein B0H16DRAFT_1559579, partial [Mycena metata]
TQPPIPEDAVAELLEKNQDVFDKVINHRFPQAFGQGTASLDGFRHYMIQDWLYLKTCTQLKFLALGTVTYGEEVEGFDVRYKVEYTNKLADICGTMLGITKSTMETTTPSTELDTTEKFYRKALQSDKAWLGFIYFKIAERLMKDPSTAKSEHRILHFYAHNSLYPFSQLSKQQPEFINKNIALNGGVKEWNWMFRIACERELEIFNTGLHAPTPFQIIPDGIHSIHISSSKGVRLVLAVHNITDLRPPLDKYLPSNPRSCILGIKPTGGDNEKWHILATKDGYTFKNLGTSLYLGISPALAHKEYRTLQAVSNPYYWWVNPSSSQPDQGPSLYQIYDSGNLRYTLHAATEALNGIGSFTPIIAHENSEAPCQMWSFDGYRFKPYERKQRTPDKDTEQSPKAQATTSEMKKLMDKHSREMKEMAEVIAARDRVLRVEVAERSKTQEQQRTPDKDSEQSPKAPATASDMKKLMDKHSREMKEVAEVIAAKDRALDVADQSKIQEQQRTPDKDDEQSPKAPATASEMKKLMDKHSREMKEMVEMIAAKDRALRVEVTERFKIQEQMKALAEKHKEELEKLERVKMAMIRTGQEQKAHILSLRNALLAAVEEAEVSDWKYRDLLRHMRAQVCHWELFSGTFRRAAFDPAPIEFGLQNNVSAFIIRYHVDGDKEISCIHSVQEGGTWNTRAASGMEVGHFQVLVGNLSHLFWAPCHGRFEVKSMLHNPVPGFDKDIDEVSDTWFIARYSYPGTVYATGVKDGTDGT